MLKKYYSILSILLAMLFVVSCSEDSTKPEVIESEVLLQYLESIDSPYGKDFVATDLPAIVTAEAVKADISAGKAYVVDVRAAADYALGHVPGAKNVAIPDILTHMKTVDATKYDKVVLICYTGQSAQFATTILRLMGYKNAFSMKWGMCSWNKDFSKRWNDIVANGNQYASQFETTPNAKPAKGTLPVLNTGKTTGKEILEARVEAVLKENYNIGVTSATVFGNLTNYYIANYWPEAQYLDPGHIKGAYQYTPKTSMKLAADLMTLPTNKEIVVYCYTGQTSAALATYLKIIGYNAKTLQFGCNGMIYDQMKAKAMTIWDETKECKNYEYEK
jgi:rhodanese-related sulfurtransferase